jgi:hypothetical protein
MHRPTIPALAALVLAAIAFPVLPEKLAAQAPDSANAGAVDPPDKVYSTGGLANDPAVDRSLPKITEYRAFLPEKVDLSNRMPAVGDQGQLGSCGAWAVAYAARSYYTETQESRDIRKPSNLPSPNYVYHLSRPGNCADGTNVDRVVAVLKQGSLSLADFPYTDACVSPAPAILVARAHDFRVRGYSQVNIGRPDDIRGQLAQGNPVIIRFFVSTAFEKLRDATTFTELAPPPGDKLTGWHFITLVAYDERRQAFRLINSWSPRWGDHGYAWLSYDLLKTTRISAAYALDVGPAKAQPIVNVPPPPPPSPAPPRPVPGVQLVDLQTLSCGRVTVETRGDQSVLSGYVGSDDDLNRVKLIAASVPNTSLGKVIVAPWPQCEALQTLEKPLSVADRPTIDIGPNADLYSGDTLKIQVRSPAQISYLYVSYIQADGSVVHLVQPNALVPQPTLPRQTLVFGSGTDGQPKFTVSPPFGREMIIAIASRSPLFDHELPMQQTERDYLSELRRALLYKPVPDMPDRELAATITTLKTSAR